MNDSDSGSLAPGLRAALPRTVVVLGFVSLLNDAASEMISPLLPIFLTATLGAGPAIVGLVEGLAEATASLLKLYSGAVVGPLAAFGLLALDADLEQVFLASAVPGTLVLLLLVVGLPAGERVAQPVRIAFSWRALHARLRAMIVAAGGLALASVPEAFVVLWATEAGMQVVWVPLVWAAASIAKMVIALPAGMLSDRLGRMPVLLAGWLSRVIILVLLALVREPPAALVWMFFVGYSATLAMTEPAERSLIGDHADAHERGTAFGLYHLASGMLVLPGAVMFGTLWETFGSPVAFLTAAAVTAGAACVLFATSR